MGTLEDLGLDDPPEPPPAEYKTVARIFGAVPCEGRLITLAGEPWTGKSSLLMTMARYYAVIRQQPAVFVSTEYPEDVIRDRLLAGLAGVSVHRVQRWGLPSREYSLLHEAKEKMDAATGLRLLSAKAVTLDTLRAQVGGDPERERQPALFIDNLQSLISWARWGGDTAPDHDEGLCGPDCPVDHVAGEVLRELKFLARDARIPIVMTSSLEKRLEGRRPGRLDVSDEVEQWSDALVLLYRESQRSPDLDVQVYSKIDFGMDWHSTLQIQGYHARAIDTTREA